MVKRLQQKLWTDFESIYEEIERTQEAGCVGYPLDEVKSQRSLPPIQWVMVKFMPEYGKKPWHPRAQIALNASPNNIQRFGNVVKGESHGTAYLIIARSTARKAKFSIIYCDLIDKRVTEYFEDYPSNDDYSINLLNSEYPFKDLNIASFSVEQANEYLDEAIARAVDALKDTVPIWREIKQ
uniref:Uncharacterized protein n=1 Tax=Ditylenchus dipsaci TaxID=166011 RepID=A0A915EQI8_9BILA